MKKYEVILGLGSNIGDKRKYLRSAIAELGVFIDNICVSSIYESKALLPKDAPPQWDVPFYNMAVIGTTGLEPNELLNVVKQIEQKLGRSKIGHWSPREIDIDILAIGNLVVDEGNLSIPHKELLKRDFVLAPLAEIAPNWVHPLAKETAKQILSTLPTTNIKQLTSSKLVGIINVTPDSFSDGGKNFTPQAAIYSINELIKDGADIIDIGAESTRPNATPISPEEEWARLEPVLKNISDFSVPVSIDTRYAKTALQALKLGAGWINDVSGFSDPEMVKAVRDSDCRLVVMHSLTVPADKNVILLPDEDPIDLILAWAQKRFAELEQAGIDRERIIFDAGIGFGKSAEQSMAIIKGITRFKELAVPLLIGHSRKSFLGDDRNDEATLKISQYLADRGVEYLRVHNVKRHRLEVL